MPEQLSARQIIDTLLSDYPDCPQREMALHLVRKGHLDQALAWVEALDELRQNGQTDLFTSLSAAKQR